MFLTLKYFGHEQCFISEFSVLALIETARLLLLEFFPDPEMTQCWSVGYVCQVCKLKLLFWAIFILIGFY